MTTRLFLIFKSSKSPNFVYLTRCSWCGNQRGAALVMPNYQHRHTRRERGREGSSLYTSLPSGKFNEWRRFFTVHSAEPQQNDCWAWGIKINCSRGVITQCGGGYRHVGSVPSRRRDGSVLFDWTVASQRSSGTRYLVFANAEKKVFCLKRKCNASRLDAHSTWHLTHRARRDITRGWFWRPASHLVSECDFVTLPKTNRKSARSATRVQLRNSKVFWKVTFILHSKNYSLSKAPLYQRVAFGMAVLGINYPFMNCKHFLPPLCSEVTVIILISAVCHFIHR